MLVFFLCLKSVVSFFVCVMCVYACLVVSRVCREMQRERERIRDREKERFLLREREERARAREARAAADLRAAESLRRDR